jgi:hypothetical protein
MHLGGDGNIQAHVMGVFSRGAATVSYGDRARRAWLRQMPCSRIAATPWCLGAVAAELFL